jgi:membrane associated rhomboid family serine protease
MVGERVRPPAWKGKMREPSKNQPEIVTFRPKTVNATQPDRKRVFNVPATVVAIIVILFVIHFLPPLLDRDWEIRRLALFAFSPARFGDPQMMNQLPGAAYYTLLTHGFLHGNFFHLATNAVWLLVFGTPVERVLGSARFLLIVALSTICGALLSLVVDWGQPILLIGASGGISGLVAAAMPIIHASDPRSRAPTKERLLDFQVLSFRELLQNYRALWFIAFWLTLTFLTGAAQFILPTALIGETRIAWEAHLGGFLAGFVLLYILAPRTIPAR